MKRKAVQFRAFMLSIAVMATCFAGFGSIIFADSVVTPVVQSGYGVVENFSQALTLTDGMKFGTDNALSIQIKGTPTFDNSSLKYLLVTEPKKTDAYIISSTNPLPAKYKLSIDVGDINYARGADDENGVEFITILNKVPVVCSPSSSANTAFNLTRKVIFNCDDNAYDLNAAKFGMFGAYTTTDSKSKFFVGTAWSDTWYSYMSYKTNTWYTFTLEKTSTDYIYTVIDTLTAKVLKTFSVAISKVLGSNLPDYWVIGDPYTNYYMGNVKFANISLIDTSKPIPTVAPTLAPTNTPEPTVAGATATATLAPTATATATLAPTATATATPTTAPTAKPTVKPTPKDTKAPVAPKVNTVKSTAKVVTGTAEVKSLITVKVRTKTIGKATVDSKGKFSVKISKQKVGVILLVTATDKAKNVSKVTKKKVVK